MKYLKAKTRVPYAGTYHNPGDKFKAADKHAHILVTVKKAEYITKAEFSEKPTEKTPAKPMQKTPDPVAATKTPAPKAPTEKPETKPGDRTDAPAKSEINDQSGIEKDEATDKNVPPSPSTGYQRRDMRAKSD